MDAWNVLSQREDDHLSLVSSELKRLDIGIAALAEVRRPDCGEIMAGGYSYYWSGHSFRKESREFEGGRFGVD